MLSPIVAVISIGLALSTSRSGRNSSISTLLVSNSNNVTHTADRVASTVHRMSRIGPFLPSAKALLSFAVAFTAGCQPRLPLGIFVSRNMITPTPPRASRVLTRRDIAKTSHSANTRGCTHCLTCVAAAYVGDEMTLGAKRWG